MQCTVYSIQYTVYSIQCTVYSVQYKVYSIQYTVCSIFNLNLTLPTWRTDLPPDLILSWPACLPFLASRPTSRLACLPFPDLNLNLPTWRTDLTPDLLPVLACLPALPDLSPGLHLPSLHHT